MDGDGDLSAFLAYLRANRGLSDNTVKAYGTDVRECLHALASRGIADLRQVTTRPAWMDGVRDPRPRPLQHGPQGRVGPFVFRLGA